MLPYWFDNMAQLRRLVTHYGWRISGEQIRKLDDNTLVGSIFSHGKRGVRVAWYL